jgi:tetratricopeptide (TPR) repeat protein
MVNGHPNDALKLFQLGQIRLGESTPAALRTDDPRVPNLTARLSRASAIAYALLDSPEQAQRYLTEAHDGWAPRNAFERAGADLGTAGIQLDLGRLDTAEQFAASAVRTYDQGHRRDRIQAQLLLAEVHVRAGEPRGLTLAHHAIDEVSTLQSVATRRQGLLPLAAALEARPNSDTQELAQLARKIAATRI